MSDTPRSTDRPRRVLLETRARQGRRVRGMMWVLLGGLFLVIAAFAALIASRATDFHNATANNGPASVNGPNPTTPKEEAGAFHAPEPAAINPQPGTDHTAPGPAPRSP